MGTRAHPLSSFSRFRRSEQCLGRNILITGRVRDCQRRQGVPWMPLYLPLRRSHHHPTENTSSSASPTLHRDMTKISHRNVNYTMIWNVLDYAACVFPVTKVDPALDQPKPAHEFLSEADQKTYEQCARDFFRGFSMLIGGFG